MSALLEAAAVGRFFGGIRAVSGVSFSVVPGEVFGIIGPNGAGKTTLFNVITGTFPPSAGRVHFDGTDITGWKTDAVARAGVVRTFQATTVFKRESVADNLRRAVLFGTVARPPRLFSPARRSAAAQSAIAGRIAEVLAFTGLARVGATPAGDLPYGLQKILGVGMAVIAQPRLMLMDEPAAGLNPNETNGMGDLVLRLRNERGITVVLVEHDMKMVMRVCDRILVLNHGVPIAVGTPAEIQGNQAVIDAYLGTDHEGADAEEEADEHA
jgi:branched-chain amino acid transport system ATP-binding protein